MSSVALRNDTLIEISTFLIRRWSENDKIIVTMSPKKVNETRMKENKIILTPVLDYNGDEFITSCNCMDEGCPNSGSPPYDRIRMPYKRFFNEHSSAGRLDVVGAAINEK